MIFITTEDLLERFNVAFDIKLENGRKNLYLDTLDSELISTLKTALNGRLHGDSISYELAISKLISKNLIELERNLQNLIIYCIFESGLVNSAFSDGQDAQNLNDIKNKFNQEIINNKLKHDLIISIASLDAIYNNKPDLGNELCNLINVEKHLQIAISAFCQFQAGKVENSLKILAEVDDQKSNDIFYHLCKNLEAFIYIQDGRFQNFSNICNDLNSLPNIKDSHLAPMIQSNLLYLTTYTENKLWNSKKHYQNVLLYNASKELDLLEKLKTSSRRLITDEIYENIEIYGKETVRFNNTPDAIIRRISRLAFLNSFMGSHAGFNESCKLFLRSFFTLADLYNDQSLHLEALRNAVQVGSKKDIEKIFRSPSFIKDTKSISFVGNLIANNPYQGNTSIGVSHLIKNSYQFINEQLAPFIVKHLKKELKKEFSFTTDFDHARPALEATYFVMQTLSKDSAVDLYKSFTESLSNIPMNMIGLDSLNKVINNLPKEIIKEDNASLNILINFYFKNVDDMLKMHYQDTLLALSLLVECSSDEHKNQYLKIIKQEITKNEDKAHLKVFLLNCLREIEGKLNIQDAIQMSNLITDKVLTPNAQNYSIESFGGIDELLISTRTFSEMPVKVQDQYLNRLYEALTDNRSSLSTKIRILNAFRMLSDKIDSSYLSPIEDFIVKNRTSLFDSKKSIDRSPFLGSSFVNYRALLYSCASVISLNNPIAFSLDLLRLSVSTETHIRELFTEATVKFIKANPQCAGNLSLLNRCYELTFDSDPKVRGHAISTILELSDKIDQEIRDTYLLRVIDLTSDKSEITRAYVALALNKFTHTLADDLINSLKEKLKVDLSFYVRRNINNEYDAGLRD